VPLYWYVLCTAKGVTPERSAIRETKYAWPFGKKPFGKSAIRRSSPRGEDAFSENA
jgi:hypothetical protein